MIAKHESLIQFSIPQTPFAVPHTAIAVVAAVGAVGRDIAEMDCLVAAAAVVAENTGVAGGVHTVVVHMETPPCRMVRNTDQTG